MSETWVYGLWRQETLAVLDEAWALRADEELSAWRAVRTWGEARDMLDRISALDPPFDREDFHHEADSERFSLADLGSVGVGGWPGIPAQWSFRLIPPEWGIGVEADTPLHGRYLLIPPEREAELVRLVDESGRSRRRDDGLINRLGTWIERL